MFTWQTRHLLIQVWCLWHRCIHHHLTVDISRYQQHTTTLTSLTQHTRQRVLHHLHTSLRTLKKRSACDNLPSASVQPRLQNKGFNLPSGRHVVTDASPPQVIYVWKKSSIFLPDPTKKLHVIYFISPRFTAEWMAVQSYLSDIHINIYLIRIYSAKILKQLYTFTYTICISRLQAVM